MGERFAMIDSGYDDSFSEDQMSLSADEASVPAASVLEIGTHLLSTSHSDCAKFGCIDVHNHA